jgi:hypothetical protein
MKTESREQNSEVTSQESEYKAEAASTDFLFFLLAPDSWLLTPAFPCGSFAYFPHNRHSKISFSEQVVH